MFRHIHIDKKVWRVLGLNTKLLDCKLFCSLIRITGFFLHILLNKLYILDFYIEEKSKDEILLGHIRIQILDVF